MADLLPDQGTRVVDLDVGDRFRHEGMTFTVTAQAGGRVEAREMRGLCRTYYDPVTADKAGEYSFRTVVERLPQAPITDAEADDLLNVPFTFDLLRDPEWQPSREFFRQYRDGARAAVAERDRLAGEVEQYRTAIKRALDTMAVANDEQLGPGGVARQAYAHLWHEYFAIPAGIPPSPDLAPASDERRNDG